MNRPEFSSDELAHYSRHLILPELNLEGQRKLKHSSVLVVGAGGLGCPVLQYLTAAGVGHIGIVDYDVVEASNLQRQVLFTTDDLGKPKARVAADRLSRLNPYIRFTIIDQKLTSENALEIMSPFDLICDGTDNFPTRYLVNDACVLLGKPNVHGAIYRFEGQVSVFNQKNKDGSRGPQYRDIFPHPPPPALAPNCAEGGVLGVLPGIIGCFQANEIIKIITGIGETLNGKMLLFDALTLETRLFKIARNPNLIVPEKLIDYEDFCGMENKRSEPVPEITVSELKNWMDKGTDFQLIDIREPYEHAIASIGGLEIPQESIEQNLDKISGTTQVVILCRSGARSSKVVQKLRKLGFDNVLNLHGGLLAWSDEIDQSLPKY